MSNAENLRLSSSVTSREILDSLSPDERGNLIHATGALLSVVNDPNLIQDIDRQIHRARGKKFDGTFDLEQFTPEFLMLAHSYSTYLHTVLFPKSREILDSLSPDERGNLIHATGVIASSIKNPELRADIDKQIHRARGKKFDDTFDLEQFTPEFLMLAHSLSNYLSSVRSQKSGI